MRFFRSIAFKLSLLSSLLVLGVIGLMAQRVFRQVERSLLAEMRLRAEFFGRSCREAIFPKPDPFALHFQVQEMLKEKAVVYAEVLDPDGKVLSHSDPRRVGETARDDLSRRALSSGEPLTQTFRDPASGELAFDLSVPVRMLTRRVGTARIGFSRASLREALRGPRRQIAAIAAACIAFAVLGTTLIVNWIIRPLPMLAEAARTVGRGRFDVSVEWRSKDEIGALSKAFNDMTVAIHLMFISLREEKEKLDTVFEQAHEGMAWTDNRGGLLISNPALGRLLGFVGEAPGTLQAALAGFECRPLLAQALSSQAPLLHCEFIRREPKLYILEAIAQRIGSEGAPPTFLFILRDVTLQRREEALERNFLSLVSHKLRTPLTVAMSYVDLILQKPEGLSEFQAKALVTVDKQIEQLRALIEKLLAFTAMQSRETIIMNREKTSLVEAVEAALKYLRELLESQRAQARWEREELSRLPAVYADPYLLQDMLKCLIENAVKFNKLPRKEVLISARAEGTMLRVSVRDNGPGIPPEEHPKLFHKFYQIDADFTGQVFGLGLGLAAVKNVVEVHGGSVGLNSTPGQGSEFFFTLPLWRG